MAATSPSLNMTFDEEERLEEEVDTLVVSNDDRDRIQNAVNVIKATPAYEHRQYDYDFNLARGILAIEEFLRGNEW